MQKTQQEKGLLKLMKTEFKKRLYKLNPEIVSNGMSASEIWKKTLTINYTARCV